MLKTVITALGGLLVLTTAAQSQVVNAPMGPTSLSNLSIKGFAPGVPGQVITPDSSIAKPGDGGRRAHTNYKVLAFPSVNAAGAQLNVKPATSGPPFSGLYYETPQSLACIYRLVSVTSGCDPNLVTAKVLKGSKVVAIVDAYDNPTLVSDLQYYSTQFGLTAPTIQVVYASGTQPANDPGWAGEEALDVQMVHALAPRAKIILVEAASNSFTDLMQAEDIASNLVSAAGAGEVSNSWGSSEFDGETSYDSHFTKLNVVYFASSGDAPGNLYPSTSANVVSVGGTSISRDPATGAFLYQSSWVDSGGGLSPYISRPSYQDGISSIVGGHRASPDVSAIANPYTGVWVYCTTGCGGSGGWYVYGGTSVASPLVAAIANDSAHFYASTALQLQNLYSNLSTHTTQPVIYGTCGVHVGYHATSSPIWDFCGGAGAPFAFRTF